MSTILPVMVYLPVRRVKAVPGGFQVQIIDDDIWEPESKIYQHSTSAFAALGRLTQNDTKAAAPARFKA